MNLFRVGEKVLSWEKLDREINKIIKLRINGLTQGEVARKLGIERTFVSRLESLGEIRKGKKIALVGFPIKNKHEILSLAKEMGIDFVLILNQKEQFRFIEDRNKTEIFNDVISIIAKLIDFDLIIFLGSDKRIDVVEKLFSIQVVGIEIGKSPIMEDKYVNPEMILEILREVKESS
ncbi:MAG: transcriptional regulator [Candidatus Atribacteria bacterium]|nr:transcriptional regulator [Candidatus Atribacteria bacterium]